MFTLQVEKRDTKTNPKTLRKQKKLPAVFYGRKEDSTPVAISLHDFEKVFRDAGESTIIALEGIGESKEALIHDVNLHPVTGVPQHVDFYVIEKGKKLIVDVSLNFIGESLAIKDLGGTLVKVMHELSIEALPKDLPHEIIVDISSLSDFESQITVKDLVLPEGVTSRVELEEVVVLVDEPKEEEEEEVETEIDMDAIEVDGTKDKEEDTEKKEEEGENKEK